MRGRLHCGDQRLPRDLALESAELLSRNDDNLITTVHRYVLRAFTPNPAHELTEARLGILQDPMAGLGRRGRARLSRLCS